MKRCAICKIEKTLDQFTKYKIKKDGLNGQCRKCIREYNYGERELKRIRKISSEICKINTKQNTKRKYAPKGTGWVNKAGYRVIRRKGHPNCTDKKGKILEHTFVMSSFLKRPLRKEETVHHKNGIKDDNRIENLELWNKRHGPWQRVEDKINWCIEFLKEYGYDVNKKV